MADLIVIDGPSGAGCSTTANLAADMLSGKMLNSGALYRALTYVAQQTLPPNSMAEDWGSSSIDKVLLQLENIQLAEDGDVWWGEKNISEAIYSQEVTIDVPIISGLVAIRRAVVNRIHQEAIFCSRPVVILEGRAGYWELNSWQLAFFIDADPRVRAIRRGKQMGYKTSDFETICLLIKELAERDWRDATRVTSPMRLAKQIDQTMIALNDTSKLDLLGWRLARQAHANPHLQICIDSTEANTASVAGLIAQVYRYHQKNKEKI